MATSSESAAAAHSTISGLIDKTASAVGTQNSVQTGERVKNLLHNFSSHYAGVRSEDGASLPIRYFRDTKGVENVQLTKSAYDFYKDELGIKPTYTFTEKDTSLIREMRDAQMASDFDNFFLNEFRNTKDPGRKAMMEKIYPELIKKKEEQLLTDIELEVRLKLLEEFGPQALEDYVVLYLQKKKMMDTLENGAIKRVAIDKKYDHVVFPEQAKEYAYNRDGSVKAGAGYSRYVPGILFRMLQMNPLMNYGGSDQLGTKWAGRLSGMGGDGDEGGDDDSDGEGKPARSLLSAASRSRGKTLTLSELETLIRSIGSLDSIENLETIVGRRKSELSKKPEEAK